MSNRNVILQKVG